MKSGLGEKRQQKNRSPRFREMCIYIYMRAGEVLFVARWVVVGWFFSGARERVTLPACCNNRVNIFSFLRHLEGFICT